MPAESLPRWLVALRYPDGPMMRRGVVRFLRRQGDISDDTQLAICVARSIDPAGEYSHQRFLSELALWSYYRIGAGRASARAAVRARRGSDRPGEPKSQGNGIAIRVAPLAICSEDDDELASVVEQNGRATHDNTVAVQAGVFVALLLRECLHRPIGLLDDQAALKAAIECVAAKSDFSPYSRGADHLALEPAPTGHVLQCIPAALTVLLRHGTDFGAAMQTIFRNGGDTDSIGAIVGAAIGAQVGYQALPTAWSASLQHRDYLLYLADRLAEPATAERQASGEVVEVYGDIASRPVDVVVNAWNRNVIPPWLLIPQGVSRAIRKAGGKAAIRDVGRRAPLPLGHAVETLAGGLAAKWVIHADAISLAWRGSERSVRDATRNALSLACWLGAKSVALPLLGAGSGGFSASRSLSIVREESARFRGCFDRIELVTV